MSSNKKTYDPKITVRVDPEIKKYLDSLDRGEKSKLVRRAISREIDRREITEPVTV